MFKKILVTNRGTIAARIIRTCREMGILTVALYTDADRGSLHVRLADECVRLESAADLFDGELMIAIARQFGADAIHPGYGFLAEEADFIRLCETNGVKFIGPSSAIVEPLRNKIATQEKAEAAGILTPKSSSVSFGADDFAEVEKAAAGLGYPLIIKSCSGGRGRGERLAKSAKHLKEAVRHAQAISQAVYGSSQIYLEKAILHAYQVGVQIVADSQGNMIHLGDREGSVLVDGMKIVEEAPARCINAQQREDMLRTALDLARIFNYQGLGTVEFLVDNDGNFYFTEFKARIQVEHSLTEMLTRLDLIEEQIRLASGEELSTRQEEVMLEGWTMMARVRANDPWHDNRSSPGIVERVRLPGGPEVRVDTYVYCGCEVPGEYVPLLANLTVWGTSRERCLARFQRALQDFAIVGTASNLPILQQIAVHPEFIEGTYSTDLQVQIGSTEAAAYPDQHLRDLATAAAMLYLRRYHLFDPEPPNRFTGGWHSSSRRLPQ
jgi:acetyl-CoA carboxylase, biotin carboxylase subunit